MFSSWKIKKLEKELGIGDTYYDTPGLWENKKLSNSEYLELLKKIQKFGFKEISYPGISKWNIKFIDLNELYKEILESNKCRDHILNMKKEDLDLKILSKCGTIFSIVFLNSLGYDDNFIDLNYYNDLRYEKYYLNNYKVK